VPVLRTYPSLKVWVAGCASGEEAHSLAILLAEEGLLARTQIYATDVSASALERARLAIYPPERLAGYEDNYRRAGGRATLAGHFDLGARRAVLAPALRASIHVAGHNLIVDEVFGEMHVVFCRNVLIYFGHELQERVLDLLGRSLVRGGFLCLGAHESLRLSSHAGAFEAVLAGSKLFRKGSGR
jgi:chemotaxis protein methyltransferase CheR